MSQRTRERIAITTRTCMGVRIASGGKHHRIDLIAPLVTYKGEATTRSITTRGAGNCLDTFFEMHIDCSLNKQTFKNPDDIFAII